MKLAFSLKSREKYTIIKYYANQSSGSHAVPCGLTDGRTDTANLIVALRNFGNEPKDEPANEV
jgi:hypothetical protein